MFRRGVQTAECGVSAPACCWYLRFVSSRIAVLHIADGIVRLVNGIDCQGRIRHLAWASGRFANGLLKLLGNAARSRDGALDGQRSGVCNFAIHGQGHIRRDGQACARWDGQGSFTINGQIILQCHIAVHNITGSWSCPEENAIPATGIFLINTGISGTIANGENDRIAILSSGKSACGPMTAAATDTWTTRSCGYHSPAADGDGAACTRAAAANTCTASSIGNHSSSSDDDGAATTINTSSTDARTTAVWGSTSRGRHGSAVDGDIAAVAAATAADACGISAASGIHRATVDGNGAAFGFFTAANTCAAIAAGGSYRAAVDRDGTRLVTVAADTSLKTASRGGKLACAAGLSIDGQAVGVGGVNTAVDGEAAPVLKDKVHIAGDGDARVDSHVTVHHIPVLLTVTRAPGGISLRHHRGAVAGLLRLLLCWVYIGNLLLR